MANYDLSADAGGSAAYPYFPPITAEHKASLSAAFQDVPNVYNFRHTGHHTLPGGRRVRTDLLFRSAEPSPITPAGCAAVSALGITTVYDLRSPGELVRNAAHMPVRDIPGTERVAAPVFTDSDPTRHARRTGYYTAPGTGGFATAYAEMLHVGQPALRAVFTHLRDRPTAPLLVHCTAGKDRTGVVVALVLALAGVDDAAIAAEYALTEQGLAPWAPTMVQVLLRDPVMEGDQARVERMISAKPENMRAFLDRLHAEWGGAAAFLEKGLGFSAEDVETIRQNITEPDE